MNFAGPTEYEEDIDSQKSVSGNRYPSDRSVCVVPHDTYHGNSTQAIEATNVIHDSCPNPSYARE